MRLNLKLSVWRNMGKRGLRGASSAYRFLRSFEFCFAIHFKTPHSRVALNTKCCLTEVAIEGMVVHTSQRRECKQSEVKKKTCGRESNLGMVITGAVIGPCFLSTVTENCIKIEWRVESTEGRAAQRRSRKITPRHCCGAENEENLKHTNL